MKRYAFDIDGTLVTNESGNYENCVPIKKAVEKVKRLYDEGNHIILYTARGQTSRTDMTDFTTRQMREFGIPYHELICGFKPSFDYFIDDKAINAQDWLDNEEEALSKVKTIDHSSKTGTFFLYLWEYFYHKLKKY